jgi:hypothetical protein
VELVVVRTGPLTTNAKRIIVHYGQSDGDVGPPRNSAIDEDGKRRTGARTLDRVPLSISDRHARRDDVDLLRGGADKHATWLAADTVDLQLELAVTV